MTPQQLREHRRELGLTQAELATRLGVTSRQVQNWELGQTPVSQLLELAMRWLLHEPHQPATNKLGRRRKNL